jgi:hypothetical protein
MVAQISEVSGFAMKRDDGGRKMEDTQIEVGGQSAKVHRRIKGQRSVSEGKRKEERGERQGPRCHKKEFLL